MYRPLRRLRTWTRRGGWALVLGFGLLLIVRAAMEPFVIDMADPATYARDWGGPSLVGVLAVHMLPGLIALLLLGWWGWRRWQQRRTPGAR